MKLWANVMAACSPKLWDPGRSLSLSLRCSSSYSLVCMPPLIGSGASPSLASRIGIDTKTQPGSPANGDERFHTVLDERRITLDHLAPTWDEPNYRCDFR